MTQFNEFQAVPDSKQRSNLHLARKTALVIEDDPFSRKFFSKILTDNFKGIEVLFADTFDMARDLIESQVHFDLVVLDIYLGSHRNGIDLYHSILLCDSDTSVLMTSVLDPMDFAKLFSDGIKVPLYLKKPFKPETFVHIVEELLEEKSK